MGHTVKNITSMANIRREVKAERHKTLLAVKENREIERISFV